MKNCFVVIVIISVFISAGVGLAGKDKPTTAPAATTKPAAVWKLKFQAGTTIGKSDGNPWLDGAGQPRWLFGSIKGLSDYLHLQEKMIWSAKTWGMAVTNKKTGKKEVYHPTVHPSGAGGVRIFDAGYIFRKPGGLAVLGFIVPRDGVYRVRGVLALSDQHKGDRKVISWKFVHTTGDPEDTQELASGAGKRGDKVNLDGMKRLGKLTCSKGDRINLILWRNRSYYYCIIGLDDYRVELVK